jgi:hypothetical protein
VSTPKEKTDPANAWLVAEDLLADEELRRIEAQSDDDVARELRALGTRVPSAEELLARAADRAAERATDDPRGHAPVSSAVQARDASLHSTTRWEARPHRSPAVWLLAAAAIGVLVGIALLLARRTPPPDEARPTLDAGSTPMLADRAARLREAAFAACDARRFDECATALDEAMTLDATGEAAPRVVRARQAIEASGHRPSPAPPLPDRKPPL